MSAVTPEPRHAIASLPAGKVLTRAWLALILMLLALIGLFYLGTGLQMETLAGKPLNMAGLALAIGVGLLCAVGPFPVWWRVGHIPWVPELGRNQRWDRHGEASRPSTRRLR